MAFEIIQGDCESLLQVDSLKKISFLGEIHFSALREIDDISRFFADYKCTENLNEIWSVESDIYKKLDREQQIGLFNDR